VHQRCLAGATESAEEEPFPREDGSVDWVRWAVHSWRTAGGAIGGILLFSEVITERKRAEQALSESRARLEALTRRLLEVQEAERRMIARELHDEVGGVLTAVKLNLQALRRTRDDAQREAALADGLALVDGTIQSVRSLSLELRPSMLDDLGLIPALKWYCERQAQRANVEINLALDAIDLKAVGQLENACFRIVQEALTNVLRHAQAHNIQVALRRGDAHFMIEIIDDGVGFDAQAARQHRLAGESTGLLSMAERVSLLGGRFGIDSAPAAGTRVWAEFSIPEEGFS
jgi:signal transduction histidine kinase